MNKLYCKNCGTIYEVKVDRIGNAEKPKYCPFCRQEAFEVKEL